MFITDKYVFIHRPKTGGMFVTETLKRLYTPDAFTKAVHSLQKRAGFQIPLYRYRYLQAENRHSLRRHIPRQHKSKPLLSNTRDPYSHYLSAYNFDWWRKGPERWLGDLDAVRAKFPSFPDLSISEFCQATNIFNAWTKVHAKDFPGLGMLSIEFVFFYARDPRQLIQYGKDFDALADALWEEIKDISWLRTRSLNSDLHAYLLSTGLPAETVDFIRVAPKVNAAKGGHSSAADAALRDYIAEKEALLIEMNARIEATLARNSAAA